MKRNDKCKFLLRGKYSKARRLEIESKIRKHVKYLYIGFYKNPESKVYIRDGIKRNNRRFSFAIMTDDNCFYYDDRKMLGLTMGSRYYNEIKRIILTPFLYGVDTEVVFEKSVTKNQPPYLVIDAVRSQCRLTVTHVESAVMYRKINNKTNLFPGWETFGEKKKDALFDKLKELGYLSYVSEEQLLQMSLKPEPQRRLMRDGIVSMLYFYYRAKTREDNRKYYEKKKMSEAKHETSSENDGIIDSET